MNLREEIRRHSTWEMTLFMQKNAVFLRLNGKKNIMTT